MSDILQFGPHTLHFESPGIAVITYHGVVTAEHMRTLCDVPDQEIHGGRFQLTICDLRELDRITPEARKVGSERARPAPFYYTAYIGANLGMRVVISLWTRGTNFVQGPKNEVGFFDDVASARAWLLKCREQRLAG